MFRIDYFLTISKRNLLVQKNCNLLILWPRYFFAEFDGYWVLAGNKKILGLHNFGVAKFGSIDVSRFCGMIVRLFIENWIYSCVPITQAGTIALTWLWNFKVTHIFVLIGLVVRALHSDIHWWDTPFFRDFSSSPIRVKPPSKRNL